MSDVVGPILHTGPAGVMREATELIARSLDGAAGSMSSRIDRFAHTLNNSGKNVNNVEGIGAEVINRNSFSLYDRGRLEHIHDIRIHPLIDHEGNVFGISFPTRKADIATGFPSDEEFYSEWSRMPNRMADREFVPKELITPADGAEPYWEEKSYSHPAPWSDDARDGMLYVQAHADTNGIHIEANLGTDTHPDWQIKVIDGEFFGRIVAANKDFLAASRAGPDKPLLMLVCSAGDPVHAHAERVARAIHHVGMNHDVYATVDVNAARIGTGKGTAEVVVTVPANIAPSDAITVIRAPNLLPDLLDDW
ncbi:hypothetical protein AB0B25_29150 [Nocardia sp. NPDC049190]|uniref:hypothetical protein n=1 Tax=Nocardia sp. NPDC049190 TaxID=3155650 RepID=UPI00340E778D